MFSVTVRDHMMIAHSFSGEVFGPAQRLHGATYVVDATFRRADARRRRHRRRHRAARPRSCTPCWRELTYRNLDDEPAFAGMNTTTEVLAQVIADRLADRVHAGALGEGARGARRAGRDAARVTRRLGELRAATVTNGALSSSPTASTTPARPSGGNVYDRRVCRGLTRSAGRCASTRCPAPGRTPTRRRWPPSTASSAQIPDGAVVLLDGLVASAAPEVLVPHARRLRLVVLVHMPLGHRPGSGEADAVRDRERAVLSAATAVVTTSAWTRRRLAELYGLPAGAIHVAAPASTPPPRAAGPQPAAALLCVAAVTSTRATTCWSTRWRRSLTCPGDCVCVGSLRSRPRLRRPRPPPAPGTPASRTASPSRDPLTGADLDRSYAAADLVVLASRAETYGMVVTEALARGLPVIATEVGGVPEALGHGADGIRPGLLVAPDDAVALGAALRAWLSDAALRDRAAPGRARASRRRCRAGRPPRRSSPASWPRRRRDRRGRPGQPATGWPCASLPTPRPARAPSAEHLSPRLPADRALRSSTTSAPAPGRWAGGWRRCCPGPSTGSCTIAMGTCSRWRPPTPPARPPTGARSPSRPGALTSPHCPRASSAGATLVTASALLDMLTEDELTELVAACAGAGCPVLLTLRSSVGSR